MERFDLTTLDAGELASSLVHAGTIVIGTSTILAGPHPLAANAAFLANALRPQAKFATVIGSYGWGGKTVEILVGMMPKLKVEFLESVLAKGMPRAADYAALDRRWLTPSLRSTKAWRPATSPTSRSAAPTSSVDRAAC